MPNERSQETASLHIPYTNRSRPNFHSRLFFHLANTAQNDCLCCVTPTADSRLFFHLVNTSQNEQNPYDQQVFLGFFRSEHLAGQSFCPPPSLLTSVPPSRRKRNRSREKRISADRFQKFPRMRIPKNRTVPSSFLLVSILPSGAYTREPTWSGPISVFKSSPV